MIRAAIFDMDGTILDTAEDLRLAVNYAMGQAGHRNDFTRDDAMRFFGSGVRVAIRRALAAEKGADAAALLAIGTAAEPPLSPEAQREAERICDIYVPYYSLHCDDHTGPYPGIPEAIRQLRARGIRTAVVSNKPNAATVQLAKERFAGLFDLAVGEHEGARRKPAPDMVEFALRQLSVAPEEACYIGDTEIDLETAANAKLRCVAVSWGFRSADYLRGLGAKSIAPDAEAMLRALIGG